MNNFYNCLFKRLFFLQLFVVCIGMAQQATASLDDQLAELEHHRALSHTQHRLTVEWNNRLRNLYAQQLVDIKKTRSLVERVKSVCFSASSIKEILRCYDLSTRSYNITNAKQTKAWLMFKALNAQSTKRVYSPEFLVHVKNQRKFYGHFNQIVSASAKLLESSTRLKLYQEAVIERERRRKDRKKRKRILSCSQTLSDIENLLKNSQLKSHQGVLTKSLKKLLSAKGSYESAIELESWSKANCPQIKGREKLKPKFNQVRQSIFESLSPERLMPIVNLKCKSTNDSIIEEGCKKGLLTSEFLYTLQNRTEGTQP